MKPVMVFVQTPLYSHPTQCSSRSFQLSDTEAFKKKGFLEISVRVEETRSTLVWPEGEFVVWGQLFITPQSSARRKPSELSLPSKASFTAFTPSQLLELPSHETHSCRKKVFISSVALRATCLISHLRFKNVCVYQALNIHLPSHALYWITYSFTVCFCISNCDIRSELFNILFLNVLYVLVSLFTYRT